MANTDKSEWVLYDVDLSTVLAILPIVGQSHLYFEHQEPGSGELKIRLDSAAALLISSGRFCACYYRGALRGGFFVENIKEVDADKEEYAGRLLSISGRSLIAVLDDAIVWADTTNTSTRVFIAKSKAYILKTLFDEARARGCFANVSLGFTATTSTDSITWTDNEDYSIEVGKSLLDVMRQLSKAGDIEFDMNLSAGAITLNAYADEIGSDVSASVFMRIGVNCEEVSSDERGEKIKNAFLAKFKSGYVTAKDTASITARRRREQHINIEAAQSADSALTFASAQLDTQKDPQKSITVKVYDGAGPKLFIDYVPGDTVSIDKLGTVVSYRVLGVQCDYDGENFSNVTLDLNYLFYDHDLETSNQLDDLLTKWNTAKDSNLTEVKKWGSVGRPNAEVYALDYYPTDGYLIVGGAFTAITGKLSASYIARYYPATGAWSAMGSAITSKVIAIADTGSIIYCATDTKIYVWSGTDWVLIGTAATTLPQIYSLYCDGTDLYVTGSFQSIDGVSCLTNVMKYSGGAWSAVGSTLQQLCLQVIKFNGVLYGAFEVTTGSNKGLQKFTAGAWSAVFATLAQEVTSMAIKGDELVFATRVSALHTLNPFLASWDGVASSFTTLATFDAIGSGNFTRIYALTTYLSDIYVSNITSIIGDTTTYKMVAKYSGGVWSSLDSDFGGTEIRAIEMVNSDAYIGGLFTINSSTIGATNDNLTVFITTFQSLINHLQNDTIFDLAAAIHGATATTVAASSDEFPLWQAASSALRKITFANLYNSLKALFDLVYPSIADLMAHLLDTSDAHDASAISIADAGNYYTGTDVEAALQEVGAGAIGTSSTPAPGVLFYMASGLSDLTEDAAFMRTLTKTKDTGGAQSGSYTALGSGETKAFIFATASGIPGIETLPKGTFRFYVTAKQTAGTRSMTVEVKLYKQNTGGTQTLLLTSSQSAALGATYVTYELTATGGPFTLNATDRLIAKVYIVGGATGTNADVSIQFANTDGERIEFSGPFGLVTNGDAHDHNGGDGGTISYPNLSNRPSFVVNANDVFRCDNCATSGWTGTINGAPSGAVVTYTNVSGNKNTLVPASSSQLGKQRLYNTTRNNSALISTSNGTSTITLTATAPANWASGDTITTISRTVSGGGMNWIDIEITSGELLSKSSAFVGLTCYDSTGAAGAATLWIHPLSTYSDSKVNNTINISTTRSKQDFYPLVLTSNVFSMAWVSSGAATGIMIIREQGYLS